MTEEVLEGIDMNRGVSIRKDPKSGIKVCMYKNEPGVFLDFAGGILPKSMAKSAGFDVDDLEKQKQYKKELGDATSDLNAKFEGVAEKEVLSERGIYKAIASGKGHADVYKGNARMNTVALTRKQATDLVEQLSENSDAEDEDSGQAP